MVRTVRDEPLAGKQRSSVGTAHNSPEIHFRESDIKKPLGIQSKGGMKQICNPAIIA
ncbi:MAG: hypothetical protein HC887_02275 [Desulfobacteraceae bacterium]|nr:hypothetical protein [Desulfobacteraceae bacterium]